MPSRKPIPPRELLTGKTYRDIMAEFGVSANTVYDWLAIYDIAVKKYDTKIPLPDKAELEILTVKQAINKYRVSSTLIYHWRRRLGIKTRPQRKAMPKPVKIDKRLKRIITVLPLLTDSEIAGAFKLSRERIGQIRAGINEENKND